jgi:hypothetical protein
MCSKQIVGTLQSFSERKIRIGLIEEPSFEGQSRGLRDLGRVVRRVQLQSTKTCRHPPRFGVPGHVLAPHLHSAFTTVELALFGEVASENLCYRV